MTESNTPLITRDQIVERVREKLGIPITKSTIEKAAMHGTGPKPAEKYGKTLLYREADALAWARTLTTSVDAA
jgi:hypothetical protein